MSRFLSLVVVLALIESVLCMQVVKREEVVLLTRPKQITDQFTVLAADDSSIIRYFVDAIKFENIQDMDILFLKASDVPVDPSQEGLSLSLQVTRSSAKSSILETYENLLKIGSGNKISKLVAGFQINCPSDFSSNCLFSLHLRSKAMTPSAAKSITSTFDVLSSKRPTQKKPFFDNISPMVWDSNGALINSGQLCSWKFSTGAFSVCFNEHSLASVMEFVRSDAISSFAFKHCSKNSSEKAIQMEVSSDAKNKLPMLMISLSLRSGTSLGFDQMSSFGFDCAGDKCLLNIAYDGDLNVIGLQNLLEMNTIISNSSCVPATDDSAWVFHRRNSMLLASFFFVESNAGQLKRILNDFNITLWKTKTTQENSRTLNTLRALGDPNFTVSFEISKIDSKLVALMHLFNSELLSSTTNGCSFLRRLIKISINRRADTGSIQFSFSKDTEMHHLKIASKYLELLCKIVDHQAVGPNVFRSSDKHQITELNLALIVDEEPALKKMKSPRNFKNNFPEEQDELLRMEKSEERRSVEEAVKFAAEKERQKKLKEEILLKKQNAEAELQEREERQHKIQRQVEELRKEELRKEELRKDELCKEEQRKEEHRRIAEAKRQEQARLQEQRHKEQLRKAEEVRRTETARLEREKAEQREVEQAKRAKQQRIREAEQRKLREETRIAEELKKAELEKKRKAEEAKQAELDKQRKAEEAKQAELEKKRKAEEAKQAELEKQRKVEEARKRTEAEERRQKKLERLQEERLKREAERKEEEERLAEERRWAQAEKKAEAEAKARTRKNREASRKAVQQKKSLFKLSEVQDVQREVSPVNRKKLGNMKDVKNIITACEQPTNTNLALVMVPIPQSSVLQALNMDYWLATNPDFIKSWDSPKASPFTHFNDDFEFWVHQGEMGEKVNYGMFIRVFNPYQSITCLESLYYNYNNAVIDVFAELPGKNHLGLFKKAHIPMTLTCRTTIRLSLEDDDQAIALLNIFWQISIMLMVQHDAEWYPYLHGVIVEPSDSKTFLLEAWWQPEVSSKLTHSFQDTFLEKARKIAQIPDEAAEWEILC